MPGSGLLQLLCGQIHDAELFRLKQKVLFTMSCSCWASPVMILKHGLHWRHPTGLVCACGVPVQSLFPWAAVHLWLSLFRLLANNACAAADAQAVHCAADQPEFTPLLGLYHGQACPPSTLTAVPI